MGVDFQRGETRLFLGLYEVELNRHLRQIAREGYKSFDIGGQYGYDALVLAKLTGAPVVSVECEPHLAREIEENAKLNRGLPEIIVHTGFVGVAPSPETVTIDELAEKYFVPDLIKLDIEGAEVEALRGATETLRRRKPALQIEVHGTVLERECLEILREAGYSLPVIVNRRRWLPEHRPIEHNRWLVFRG